MDDQMFSDDEFEGSVSFTLRSQCLRKHCPMGSGLQFNSRISPSPSKRKRKRASMAALQALVENPISEVVRKLHFDDFTESPTSNHQKHKPHFPFELNNSLEVNLKADMNNDLSNSVPNLTKPKNKERLKLKRLKLKTKQVAFIENQFDGSPSTPMSSDLSNSQGEIFVPGNDFFALQDSEKARLTSDYFSGTDTPSKLKESTRRLTLYKEFNHYIAYSSDEEFEDWRERPKTDYTYSFSLSYREQVTPDRHIDSPNMSRSSINSSKNSSFLASPPFSQRHQRQFTSNVNRVNDGLSLKSKKINKKGLLAYSDESDEEIGRVTRSKKKSSQYFSESQSNTTTTMRSKSIVFGLDVDSDADDLPGSISYERPVSRSLRSTFKPNTSYKYPSNGHLNAENTRLMDRNSIKSQSYKETGGIWVNEMIDGVRKYRRKVQSYFNEVWVRSKYLFSLICTYLSLWSFTFYNKVKNLFTKASVRSRKTKSLSQNISQRRTRSQTYPTAAVVTKRKTYHAFAEDVINWYKRNKSLRPWLWLWLPLFITLLLLTSMLIYFHDAASYHGHPDSVSSSTIRRSFDINQFYSEILSIGQFVSQIFFYSLGKIFDFALSTLQIMWSLILYISSIFKAIALWISSSLTFTKEANISIPSESLKTESDSSYALSSNLISDASAFILSGFQNGLMCLWEYSVSVLNYGVTLLISLFDIILSILNAFWYCLQALFSAIGSVFLHILQGSVAIVSKIFELSQNSLEVFKFSVSNQENSAPSTSSIRSSSASVEELIQQIVTDPKLIALLSVRIQEFSTSTHSSPLKEYNATLNEMFKTEVGKMQNSLESTIGQFKSDTSDKLQNLQIQKEILQLQLTELKSSLDELRVQYDEMKNSKTDGQSINNLRTLVNDLDENINKLKHEIDSLKTELGSLSLKLKSCCDKTPVTLKQVEDHVSILLTDLLGMNSTHTQGILSSKLGSWMNNYFLAKDEMESTLQTLWERREKDKENGDSERAAEEQSAEHIMNLVLDQLRTELFLYQEKINSELKENNKTLENFEDTIKEIIKNQTLLETQNEQNSQFETNSDSWDGINELQVRKIVRQALNKYDADKTGLVDHALESAGGSIVSTRCTEEYQGHQAELTIFGYSVLRYSTNTPRSIIQPDRMPGQCYAFKGSQGYVVIQLAGPVKITAFSVEHIPKVLTPTGTIDSAPKEFAVYGLQTPEEEGVFLGTFTYDNAGESLQYFPVANPPNEYFKFVELKIFSNHGNMNYTCIYRFRVHGIRI